MYVSMYKWFYYVCIPFKRKVYVLFIIEADVTLF